eukprot:13297960-Ditylum_brightwellii.AAC.1
MLEHHDTLPALMEVDITEDVVLKVATKIQGATCPSEINSIAWQDWLLKFGKASCRLWESVAPVACCLANTHPAWASYQAIIAGRLIACNK